MCAAALAWHDRLQPPRYRSVLHRWLASVDTHLDSLQLIPHRTGARSGQVLEAARGSSQSQLLNFLAEVDSTYAHQHFLRYRQHFLTSRFGLPGIREASAGAPDVLDIDSGPVLLGVGGAASIVGRRTMQRYQDTITATGLRNSIEAFGMPWQHQGQKRYLFGALPIADAFIAWSNSLEVNRASSAAQGWRWAFHGWSMLVASLLLLLLRLLRKPMGGTDDTCLHSATLAAQP